MLILDKIKKLVSKDQQGEAPQVTTYTAKKPTPDQIKERAFERMANPEKGVSIAKVIELVNKRQMTPEHAQHIFKESIKTAVQSSHYDEGSPFKNEVTHSERGSALAWALTHVDGNEPPSTVPEEHQFIVASKPAVPLSAVLSSAKECGGLSHEATDDILPEARKFNAYSGMLSSDHVKAEEIFRDEVNEVNQTHESKESHHPDERAKKAKIDLSSDMEM